MITKINGVPITTQFHAIDAVHSLPHQGLDLALPMNTPIPSISDGVVIAVVDEGNVSFGKSVHVHMTNGDDVIYAHLNSFNVKVGDHINTGDIIGNSGSTGHSTGPHLHVQIMHDGWAVDPTPYLQNVSLIHKDIPWWDFKGQAIQACQGVEDWIFSEAHRLGNLLLHDIGIGLTIALPTLATIGVLWWMIPFIPKSDHAPKLTGLSMLAYMFLILIKGAMSHG